MRCKMGDLVRVVRPAYPQNKDRIGTIVDSSNEFGDDWEVEFPTPVVTTWMGMTSSCRRCWYADSQLEPIRDPGPDAVDETLRELEGVE